MSKVGVDVIATQDDSVEVPVTELVRLNSREEKLDPHPQYITKDEAGNVYVAPARTRQHYDDVIKAAKTTEELDAVVIDYALPVQG